MLWILISLVFILLIIIAWFGDYEEDERKKDYKKYEELINGNMGKK